MGDRVFAGRTSSMPAGFYRALQNFEGVIALVEHVRASASVVNVLPLEFRVARKRKNRKPVVADPLAAAAALAAAAIVPQPAEAGLAAARLVAARLVAAVAGLEAAA